MRSRYGRGVTREYVAIKSSLVRDRISRERARALYDEAAADPASELTGDPVSGFAFRQVDPETGLQLGRTRVEPVSE